MLTVGTTRNAWKQQGETLVAVRRPPNLEETSWEAVRVKADSLDGIHLQKNCKYHAEKSTIVSGWYPGHVLEQSCDMMNGQYQAELGLDEPRSHMNQAGVIVYREEGTSCGVGRALSCEI